MTLLTLKPSDEKRKSMFSMNRLLGPSLKNPLLRSGIALAGANTWFRGQELPTDAGDGILTAQDVSALDLSGTQLVVLSCCETGLGDVSTNEGVFGLRRAFVIAGAKTLVMTLWKVPDRQTKALMIDFYSRMHDGISCGDALREAQLEMKKKMEDPYYWGAFICQGDRSTTLYQSLTNCVTKGTNHVTYT